MISVIVPVYNVENYLERCIESLIKQSYKDIEIILVDDGSTDNSSDICKNYQKIDNRIIYIKKSNGGLSSARNMGIDLATGTEIYFIDSDDFLTINALEIMMLEMKKNNCDIVSAGFTMVCEDVVPRIEDVTIDCRFDIGDKNDFLLQKISNHACGKLYKKGLFDEIRYPLERNYEDIATTYLLFDKSIKISYTNAGLYFYRIRKNAITSNLNKKNIEDIKKAFSEIDVFYYDNNEYQVFYKLTVLYTLYSRLQRTDKSIKLYKVENEKMIRQKFHELISKICLKNFKRKSPLYYKLVFYKIKITKICIWFVDITRRIKGLREKI